MTRGIEISGAELVVKADDLAALKRFYVDELGFSCRSSERDRLELAAGRATLTFVGNSGAARPFYHFALLISGNRFDAARDWLAATTSLLSQPDEEATTFEFDSWDAQACYAHDPASNIIELIAHRGIEESDETGPFDADELRGLSEVGLVAGGLPRAIEVLRSVGLELWSGKLDEQGSSLGFIGRQAHTLILCSAGRPWLPTGRPAELHRSRSQ